MFVSDLVPAIEAYSFFNCRKMTDIVIGKGVRVLETCCFMNCSSLREIILGEHVTALNSHCLANCESLIRVVIPNGVTRLPGIFSGAERLWGLTVHPGITMFSPDLFDMTTSFHHLHLLGTSVSPTLCAAIDSELYVNRMDVTIFVTQDFPNTTVCGRTPYRSPTPTPVPPPEPGRKFTAGQIAGIVVGSLTAVALIVVVVVFAFKGENGDDGLSQERMLVTTEYEGPAS
jgi:hypothetical protein